MKINFKRIILILLALQLSLMPVLQTYANQNHPQSVTEKVVSLDNEVMEHNTDLYGIKKTQCNESFGHIDQCVSCLCINVVVFPSLLSIKHKSNLIEANIIPKLASYHIYLSPPFRPPIT